MPIKFQAKLNSKAHFGQTAYTDVIQLTLTLTMTTTLQQHCQQPQSYAGLRTPGQSCSTYTCT